MNLPETLGTHFSLKITALREYLSVAISSGLIIIWKCRKVLSSVSYKFLCGRKYCFWTMQNTIKIVWIFFYGKLRGAKHELCRIAQCFSNKKASWIIHNYSCQFLKKMQFLVFFLAGIKNNETRKWLNKWNSIEDVKALVLLQKLPDKQKQKCFQKEKGLERHPKVS